jgi:PKD repeat protein
MIMNFKKIFLYLLLIATVQSCKKYDFPVPPASTVSKFIYTFENGSFAPANVSFSNVSIVPASVGNAIYSWNFGDTTFSELENPTHLYETPGAYQVSLTVSTSISLEVKTSIQTIVIKDINAVGTPIYFTDGSFVFKSLVNNLTPIFEQLPISGLQDSYGMTIDTVHSKIYVSDYDAGVILQANLDGTNQIVFRNGLDSPDALTIDYQENQIYWDNSNGIQRADLLNNDVSQKEDFVTGQSNDPDGICIDPITRTLFWVNYDGGVWKKNLDGTGEGLIIETAGGGSMLVVGNRIYYDDYIASGNIYLRSANFDGTDVSLLATGISKIVYGLGYDPLGQKIYWGDRNIGTIVRANLDGSMAQPWFVQEGSSPRGIVFGKPI